VTDPRAALHQVAGYEERLYSDVQLAARRSLASMALEDILTNRNRLNEDILRDVKETASSYGVAIQRADVKDLLFPGGLQEIMNRVLAAERTAQAQLVEARTQAEVQRIDAQAKAQIHQVEAEARAAAARTAAESEADAQRIRTAADVGRCGRRRRPRRPTPPTGAPAAQGAGGDARAGDPGQRADLHRVRQARAAGSGGGRRGVSRDRGQRAGGDDPRSVHPTRAG